MVRAERRPRGEIAARVREQLAKGLQSYHQISNATKIPTAQVVHAISEFQRRGEHTPNDQTKALRQHEHDEAHSESRGGLWRIIRPYAHLGMWPGEIKAVVEMVEGIELNRTNIKNTLVKKRKKGYISSSPPKKGDSGKTIDRQLLLLWLDAVAFSVNRIDLKTVTLTRGRWLNFVQSLADIGIVTPDLSRWRKARPQWMDKCKEREREVIRRKLSVNRGE